MTMRPTIKMSLSLADSMVPVDMTSENCWQTGWAMSSMTARSLK